MVLAELSTTTRTRFSETNHLIELSQSFKGTAAVKENLTIKRESGAAVKDTVALSKTLALLEQNLVIAVHVLTAGGLIIASSITVSFVGVLPLWLGILIGVLLYALTLAISKADDGDEEIRIAG